MNNQGQQTLETIQTAMTNVNINAVGTINA